MDADKQLGPLFEDLILLNVMTPIDPRLPQFIKEYYQLKLRERQLMDIKVDIFNNVKKFIFILDNVKQCLQNMTVIPAQQSPSLAAFRAMKNIQA